MEFVKPQLIQGVYSSSEIELASPFNGEHIFNDQIAIMQFFYHSIYAIKSI